MARGLSTIGARIRGVGEDGEALAGLTPKLEDLVKSVTNGEGVLNSQTGELRSTYDILRDLSKGWGSLTSMQQQNLAEQVAGKNQFTLFQAIMTNFSSAIGATESAYNSLGSAQKENEKRMDSIQGKITQFQSAWEELATKTLSGDVVKGFLSFATALVKITDAAGGLTPILTGLVGVMLMMNATKIASFMPSFISGIQGMFTGMKALNIALTQGKLGLATYASAMVATGQATSTTAALTAMAVPIIGAITIAVSALVMAYNSYQASVQAGIDQAKEEIKIHNENLTALEEAKVKYEEIANSTKSDTDKKKELIIAQKELNTALKGTQVELSNETGEINKNIDAIKEKIKQEAAAKAGSALGVIDTGKTKTKSGRIFDYIEETDETTGKSKEVTASEAERVNILKKQIELLGSKKDATEEDKKALRSYNEELAANIKWYDEQKEAWQDYIDARQEQGIPLTAEEIAQAAQYRVALTETTDAQSTAVEQSTILATAVQTTNTQMDELNGTLSNQIEELAGYSEQMGMLTSAQSELNEYGSLTAETFQELANNNLLQYLEMVDGQVRVNTDAFDNNTNALKTNAEQTVQASLYNQILGIVQEDMQAKLTASGNAAATAGDKIFNAGDNAAVAGGKFIAAAGDAAALATGLQSIYTAQGGTGTYDTTAVQGKITDAINNAKATIDTIKKLDVGGGASRGKRSGNSASKSSAATAKEIYKPQIDWLQRYENALENAKDEVDSLKSELGRTENFQEQERITRSLINATNEQITQTQELKNAQAGQMQDAIKQLRNYGFAIDYNSDKSELYINNIGRLGDFTGDTAKAIEKLIDKTQSLNKDNIGLDSSIRDLTSAVSDYYKQLADFPEKKLEKFNELMSEFQKSQMQLIENQISDLEHAMKNDARLIALNKEIDALKAQTEEVDKQAELNEKLLSIEKAKIALENLRKQKTVQIYRAGKGFVYEADLNAIEDAESDLTSKQKDLNDYITDEQLNNLEQQVSDIEKGYQDKIDVLQNFLDEQDYLLEKSGRAAIETFGALRDKLAEFGLDSSNYLSQATQWLDRYNTALKNVNTNGLVNATAQTLFSSGLSNNSNLALSGMSYESLLASVNQPTIGTKAMGSNNTTNITIENIELPNVKDVDSFLDALESLPDLASARATSRK